MTWTKRSELQLYRFFLSLFAFRLVIRVRDNQSRNPIRNDRMEHIPASTLKLSIGLPFSRSVTRRARTPPTEPLYPRSPFRCPWPRSPENRFPPYGQNLKKLEIESAPRRPRERLTFRVPIVCQRTRNYLTSPIATYSNRKRRSLLKMPLDLGFL